ncbi:MAG: NAD-dependent epimerase/dehydratase family protein [Elusimicrobiota bacterium]
MDRNDKIYLAGHKGLIGSAILRRLIKDGYLNIITKEHSELDLCDQYQVKAFFEKEKPVYVILAAAKVGGVYANNTYRADFIYENIMIQSNVIHHSFLNEVNKLLFLSSADAYPKNFQDSAKEEDLLTGPLETTCEPFAIAKIAGVKMCESYNRQYGTDFIVVIPPNVYGPHQHYDILNAQVLPSLIKKFHEAKTSGLNEVTIWGTGSPVRDFLFVDDLADACIFLINNCTGGDYFNAGTGKATSILELTETVKKVVGYKGKIIFDKTKPDGVARKLLNISKIKSFGWSAKTGLAGGLKISYNSYLTEMEKKEVRISKICNIKICEKDIAAINKLKSPDKNISVNIQPDNYKNKVVIKPWGYEFLVFENEKTSAWLLYIKKGNSTSMHCHPQKKTSLIILSGRAMSNTFSSRNYLKGGDAIIIENGVFHFTKVLSDDGLFILEIESPPIKTDLLRLEDKYGRQAAGYEGVTEMQTQNLENYGYFNFEESNCYEKYTHNGGRFIVSFEVFPNNHDFQKYFNIKENCLYTSCNGNLMDKENNILLNTADTQKSDTLPSIKEIHISEKTVLLKTISKDKYNI